MSIPLYPYRIKCLHNKFSTWRSSSRLFVIKQNLITNFVRNEKISWSPAIHYVEGWLYNEWIVILEFYCTLSSWKPRFDFFMRNEPIEFHRPFAQCKSWLGMSESKYFHYTMQSTYKNYGLGKRSFRAIVTSQDSFICFFGATVSVGVSLDIQLFICVD